jgi:hypothetical protein
MISSGPFSFLKHIRQRHEHMNEVSAVPFAEHGSWTAESV